MDNLVGCRSVWRRIVVADQGVWTSSTSGPTLHGNGDGFGVAGEAQIVDDVAGHIVGAAGRAGEVADSAEVGRVHRDRLAGDLVAVEGEVTGAGRRIVEAVTYYRPVGIASREQLGDRVPLVEAESMIATGHHRRL